MQIIRLGLGGCKALRHNVSIGRSTRGASLSERLASVLSRERCPGLEAGQRHSSSKATTVFTTLAPNTTSDRSVLKKVEVSLGHLPELNASNEHNSEANGQSPLPSDASVLEELVIKDGNVDNREDGETANDNGPEEEAVGVDVLEHGELAVVVGVKAEDGAAQTLELPGRDEDQPCQLSKSSSASLEHGDTLLGVSLIALEAEVAAVGTIDDDDESAHCASTHDNTVDNHVDDDLVGENTALLILRRLAHDVLSTLLATESEGRE